MHAFTNQSYSQGRDRTKFFLLIDTSFVSIDTSTTGDTTKLRAPVDSTARIKNFKYERDDKPVTSFDDKIHPLLLGRSYHVEYKLSFDSLNNAVISESFDKEQVKVPLVISIDKYIESRTKIERRNQLYTILAEFYKIETEDELSKLFKNITEITIPLPFTTETIFGPPTINLRINGVIDITASYQKTVIDQATITQETQDQDNINFKQEVQVTTKGTIGDKLTIDADWNSQRTFDYENQLKLKYTGYPDEVIQSLEAGNVSLDTRSTLIGGNQALFGVKAQFKLGPLSLTAIASQKKSEKKEISVTGGTVETPFNISAWNYGENNYLLDEKYDSSFVQYYRGDSTKININRVEVWVYSAQNNPKKRSVVGFDTISIRPQSGYTWLDTVITGVDGKILLGNFYKLSDDEFTLNKRAGYITLSGNIQNAPNDAICVAYTLDSSGSTRQYGDFSEDAPTGRVKLKLLRYRSQQSPDQNTNHATLWKRMLKNIYNLGVRNLDNNPSSIPEFNIYYTPPSGTAEKDYNGSGPANGRSYLNLVKLDIRINGSPTIVPEGDNQFDFFPGTTIDRVNGNVIFPTIRPFSYTLKEAGVDSIHIGKNDTIYESSKTTAQQFGNIKFTLVGKAKGEASSRYSLGFNVVEGSVKVFNGSVELQKGIDYTMDYSIGELVIINGAVLVSGSNLKITYESNDLFTLASKTLIGTRAELNISKSTYIGFTLINLKQQTLNEKVRIGEEPTNNTIIGFDASTDIKTNFLTKLINKIPGYYTKDESLLNLKGEVAFMLPDPNTKKSRIPSDNGEAIAYIDDFEGIKKVIPLGMNPLLWTISSIPLYELPNIPINDPNRDSLTGVYRAKLNWFSQLNGVAISEVYPNRSTATNQNQSLTPFVFDVLPRKVGTYNYIKQSQFEINSGNNYRKNWSGVFRYLNTSQTNLIDENYNYIEIWMQVNMDDSSFVGKNDSAKMLIDLGAISEKIITHRKIFPPNSTETTVDYNTEDKNNNGALEESEDNGIDGYTNAEEKSIMDAHNLDYDDPNDPARDDFQWTQGSDNFTKFNGTEKNAQFLAEAKKIDTEDLNNSSSFDENNKYFEYEIPLNNLVIGQHPYIVGGGNNRWYQFIIPLDQSKRQFNEPSLTNIEYVRVWFKGFDDSARIRIVDFNIVGNQWIKQNKIDSAYSISLVNIEDNYNIYRSPVEGDILRQRDPNQPDQEVLSNEQSLSLDVNEVLPGQSKIVFKSYTTRPLDLINYKILKLFVNGDTSFTYSNNEVYDAAVIVRLGSDTSNYYEYRAPIHPDIRPGSPWESLNEVII
ncbi:MAG TPA: cell surface protein SprA, partial [Ignavibacteria bacterium]|nr:cell surface protein SprA [Ignavibacteria bacterium]